MLPALQDKPELFQDVVPYYVAFHNLSNSRATGFGIGYISFSEIVCYLNEELIFNYEERKEYIHWIQFIDEHFVKLQHDKQKKESEKDKPKTNGVRPPKRPVK